LTEHGAYEESELNGVYDEDWAIWYAAWALEHDLNELLNTSFDASKLAQVLVDVNDEHQRTNTGEDWAQFTARRLVEKYSV
jgi:hypothetical protein